MQLNSIENTGVQFVKSTLQTVAIVSMAMLLASSALLAQSERGAIIHTVKSINSTVVEVHYDVNFANENGSTDYIPNCAVLEYIDGRDGGGWGQPINQFDIPVPKYDVTGDVQNNQNDHKLEVSVGFNGRFRIFLLMDSETYNSSATSVDIEMLDGNLTFVPPSGPVLGGPGPYPFRSVTLDCESSSTFDLNGFGNTVYENPVDKSLESVSPVQGYDDYLTFCLTPQLAPYHSNLGIGATTSYDYSLHKFWVRDTPGVDDYIAVRIVDIELGRVVTFHDVIDNHIPEAGEVGGSLHDEFGIYRDARIEGNTVKVTRHSGDELVFELFDFSPRPDDDEDAEQDQEGRIKQINYCDGGTFLFEYDKNYEISKLTTPGNHDIHFTYSGTLQGGRPAIDEVLYPNNTKLKFSYANNVVNKIEVLPVGQTLPTWVWQNDVVAGAGGVDFVVQNPELGNRTYTVTAEYINLSDELTAQPSANLQKITGETSNDILLQIFPNENDAHEFMMYSGIAGFNVGSGFLHHVYHGVSVRPIKTWTFDSSQSNPFEKFILAEGYSNFARNIWLNSAGQTSTTFAYSREWTLGAPDKIIDSVGNEILVDYMTDESMFVAKKTYITQGPNVCEIFDRDPVTREILSYTDRMGRVTSYVYGARCGRQVISRTEADGSDCIGAYSYDYVDINSDLVKTAYDPLYNSAFPDMHRTDFTYDGRKIASITEGADVSGGPRAVTTIIYQDNILKEVRSPASGQNPAKKRSTTYVHDDLNRVIQINYDDGSNDQFLYGLTGSGLAEYIVKSKNRTGATTTYDYDHYGRNTLTIAGYSQSDDILGGSSETPNPVTSQHIIEIGYHHLFNLESGRVVNGREKSYIYDQRGRRVSTTISPDTRGDLVSTAEYKDNRLDFTTDPYGRRTFYGYSTTSKGKVQRIVTETIAGSVTFNADNNEARLSFDRVETDADDNPINAQWLINDFEYNLEDELTNFYGARINPDISPTVNFNGYETEFVVDCRGRMTSQIEAVGTSVQRETTTVYDAANNVTEFHSPRSNDPNDELGAHAIVKFTYNGRNRESGRTAAPLSNVAATSGQTYFLDGTRETFTDARQFDWHNKYDACCQRLQLTEDNDGNGRLTNTDFEGRVTHSAYLEDVNSHSRLSNPGASLTIRESTGRYDSLGRLTQSTAWLQPQGAIDANEAPIAGLDGLPVADGLTSQIYYDSNLDDDIGLDDSNNGMTIQKLGGSGNYSLNLQSCLDLLNAPDKLVAFGFRSAGQAIVSINPEEEISVLIADGIGRTVMTAQLRPHSSANPFEIIDYQITVHFDPSLSASTDLVETQIFDGANNVSKIRMDGAGRAIEIEDQLQQVSNAIYDNNGNPVVALDAVDVGMREVTYDALDRRTFSEDTHGTTTTIVYDAADNPTSVTDSKGIATVCTFDARNRKATVTDRVGGVTTYTYDENSNLLAVEDAESRQTDYVYNFRNQLQEIAFPGHDDSKPWNHPDFDKQEFEYDPAGRLLSTRKQTGNYIFNEYDMANRRLQRRYGDLNTIVDQDTFTYDGVSRVLTAHKQRYSNTVEMTYDDAGRIETESLTTAGRTYTVERQYDSRSNISQYMYPDGTLVDRIYDERNQLQSVFYNGLDGSGSSVVDTRTYDDGGRLKTSVFGNGVTSRFNYRGQDSNAGEDKDNMLASIEITQPSYPDVGTYSYTYDENKNKQTETILAGQAGMNRHSFSSINPSNSTDDGYDDMDRLTYWKNSDTVNPEWKEWDLSLVGDWDLFVDSTGTHDREYSPVHELISEEVNTVVSSVESDEKGNVTYIPASMTGSGQAARMTWDTDDQLASYDKNDDGTVTQFEYDAFGRLVRWHGNKIRVHAGPQMVAEYNRGRPASQPFLRHVYGSYVDEPIMFVIHNGGKYYLHRNHQYSITAITDSNGIVRQRMAYDAHGDTKLLHAAGVAEVTWMLNNQRFGFTGRAKVGDLYYFRARWYSGKLGQFLSRDPKGYVDGMSVYKGYFAVNGMDPTGTQQEQEKGPFTDYEAKKRLQKLRDIHGGNLKIPAGRHRDAWIRWMEGNDSTPTPPPAIPTIPEGPLRSGHSSGSRKIGDTPNAEFAKDAGWMGLIVGYGGAYLFDNEEFKREMEKEIVKKVIEDAITRKVPVEKIGEWLRRGAEGKIDDTLGFAKRKKKKKDKDAPNSAVHISPITGRPVSLSGRVRQVKPANGPTRFTPLRQSGNPVAAGLDHVQARHFGGTNSQSQFSISVGELKTILQGPTVRNAPIRQIGTGRQAMFARDVDVGRIVGRTRVSDGANATSTIRVFVDEAGNLITTFPIPGT